MSDDFKPPWDHDGPAKETPMPAPLRLIPGRKENGKNKHGKKLAKRTVENLTPQMKSKRDRFISEYVKDFNGPMAYIRAGGPSTTAVKMSGEYLREPYVSQQVWAVIDSMEEAEIINRKHILAGLVREAQFQGQGASHGARVSAWAHLAKILGMEQTNVNVKGSINHNVRGGVMVVPVLPGSEAWEQMAEQAQKQLKEDVRK